MKTIASNKMQEAPHDANARITHYGGNVAYAASFTSARFTGHVNQHKKQFILIH